MIFRIEDEERLLCSKRKYNRTYMEAYEDLDEISADEADKYVADLIRKQVNGCIDSRLFSSTMSLGIALFKYNEDGLNPIICSDLPPEVNGTYLKTGHIQLSKGFEYPRDIPFSINDLSFPIKKWADGHDVRIWQFIVPVNDNDALDRYLKHYTDTHKKIVASPEKDAEIISTDLSDYPKLDTYKDALYILFSLHFRFKILYNENIYEDLQRFVRQYILTNDDCEAYGFIRILSYMNHEYEFKNEIDNSSKWISTMIAEINPVTEIYNGYAFANEMLHITGDAHTNNPLFVIKKYIDYINPIDKLSKFIIKLFLIFMEDNKYNCDLFSEFIDEFEERKR